MYRVIMTSYFTGLWFCGCGLLRKISSMKVFWNEGRIMDCYCRGRNFHGQKLLLVFPKPQNISIIQIRTENS